MNPRALLSACFSILVFATASCLETGATVVTSPEGLYGSVVDRRGDPARGVWVQLAMLDDKGAVSWAAEPVLTDKEGGFVLPLTEALAPGFVVQAHLGSGILRALALSDGAGVKVHPATEALVQVLLDVVTAGQSFSALDPETLRTLHDRTLSALPRSIDLEDESGLVALVRAEVGDLLAAAFQGLIVAKPGGDLLGPNVVSLGPDFSMLPPPEIRATCNRVNTLLAGASFRFDMLEDGQVCDGNDGNRYDAFDGAFSLRILGDTFAGDAERFPAQTETLIEDGQELAFGPEVTAAGLWVTRKVSVGANDDVARFLEIFDNPTATAVTLDIEIDGELGSGDETVLLVTEHGNNRVEAQDHFAASLALFQLDPTVGIVWDGYGRDAADRTSFAPDIVGGFQYVWRDVVIPPGGKVVYAHYVWLTLRRDASSVADKLAAILSSPNLEGLSEEELRGLANFPVESLANVWGAPGAMAPAQMLTIGNLTTLSQVSVVARPDGSFKALMLDAETNQELVMQTLGGFVRNVWVSE